MTPLNKISKKEAKKLRQKELEKRWKKKHFKETLTKLPKDFQDEYSKLRKSTITKVSNTYLYGETGTGKTFLACQMFIEAVKKLYLRNGYFNALRIEFINFPDFLIKMQSIIGSAEYYKRYAEILESHILILDDLDARKATDWMIDLIYNVINQRQNPKLITIITSNNDLNELVNIFQDDRIIRRISKYEVSKKQHYSKIKL